MTDTSIMVMVYTILIFRLIGMNFLCILYNFEFKSKEEKAGYGMLMKDSQHDMSINQKGGE